MFSAAFEVKPGDWQELTVELTDKAPLGTMRLFLPATQDRPVEIDSIELKPASGSPQRWDF
jgi:hypothetical protein